jgi:alkylation response protein AidB-like acyl-CoA dehydrogenase
MCARMCALCCRVGHKAAKREIAAAKVVAPEVALQVIDAAVQVCACVCVLCVWGPAYLFVPAVLLLPARTHACHP